MPGEKLPGWRDDFCEEFTQPSDAVGSVVYVGDVVTGDEMLSPDLAHFGKVVGGQEDYTQSPGYVDPKLHAPYLGDDVDAFREAHGFGGRV